MNGRQIVFNTDTRPIDGLPLGSFDLNELEFWLLSDVARPLESQYTEANLTTYFQGLNGIVMDARYFFPSQARSHRGGIQTPTSFQITASGPGAEVPLPASGWLLLAGLAGGAVAARRRQR